MSDKITTSREVFDSRKIFIGDLIEYKYANFGAINGEAYNEEITIVGIVRDVNLSVISVLAQDTDDFATLTETTIHLRDCSRLKVLRRTSINERMAENERN